MNQSYDMVRLLRDPSSLLLRVRILRMWREPIERGPNSNLGGVAIIRDLDMTCKHTPLLWKEPLVIHTVTGNG